MVIATAVGGRKMWFGTRDWMQWIETPQKGADVSPDSWGAGGTFLNGGGWQKAASQSHKKYQFSWSNTSARQAAQIMKSYRDGSWGTGPFYFHDPLTYTTNILPAAWADPSLATRGGPSLVPGVKPSATRSIWVDTPQRFRLQEYPLMWTRYDLPVSAQGQVKRLFIPIPEGMSLHFGAVWHGTPNIGIRGRRVKEDGTFGPTFTMESVPNHDHRVTNLEIVGNGDAGIEIWIGKDGTSNASIALKAMTARLQDQFKSPDVIQLGPWVGGQGHSGVQFDGVPTYVEYTGLNGGQVGYSATFREVGDWL